mmetsp:Transcript_4315/g.5645  ORF Transcript_4315/g.5645 Transcript_4315/m.5645 type:complete len:276 (-) Transcript_4315:14-841(-)
MSFRLILPKFACEPSMSRPSSTSEPTFTAFSPVMVRSVNVAVAPSVVLPAKDRTPVPLLVKDIAASASAASEASPARTVSSFSVGSVIVTSVAASSPPQAVRSVSAAAPYINFFMFDSLFNRSPISISYDPVEAYLMIIDKGDKMALRTKSGETVKVRFEINPKARRLILRLDERRREAVAVAPSKKKIGEAAAFARDRIDWIAEHLQALPEQTILQPGAQFMLRGEICQITVEGPGRVPKLEIGPPLTLRVPGDEETTGKRVERYLRKAAKSDQ